jgi:hypothetical protein
MAPRCIVELRWGRLAGTKAVIRPGMTLRVGRSDRTALPVPHDAELSNVHFELAWDGETCRVRDLGSASGTTLGGAPVPLSGDTEVPHGGWIRAGQTDFLVYVEGRVPPPDEDEELGEVDEATGEPVDEEARARWAKRREASARALATLREEAAREPLYAVLDGARDDRILMHLRASVEPHRSLYEGAEGETFEDVAPYLAGPMQTDSDLLDRLISEGFGRRWGIYCTSREPFREVRRHFRRFLMVEVEETGERVYFRFYDPDVMKTFAEVCTPMQRGQLRACIRQIWVEDAEGVTAVA